MRYEYSDGKERVLKPHNDDNIMQLSISTLSHRKNYNNRHFVDNYSVSAFNNEHDDFVKFNKKLNNN